jgi:hypothetical protein
MIVRITVIPVCRLASAETFRQVVIRVPRHKRSDPYLAVGPFRAAASPLPPGVVRPNAARLPGYRSAGC